MYNLTFLKSIFPPNYYIGSTTILSEDQKTILQKIINEVNSSDLHFVELNIQQIEAINICIDDFIRIAESEAQTVSGYSKSELITKKIIAQNSSINI